MPVPPPNDPLRAPLQLRFLPEEDCFPPPSGPGTQPKPSTSTWPLFLVSFAVLGVAWQNRLLPLPTLTALPWQATEPASTNATQVVQGTGLPTIIATREHTQAEPSGPISRPLLETAAHWEKSSTANLGSSFSSSPSLATTLPSLLRETGGHGLPQPSVARDIGDDRTVKLSVYDAAPDGTDCRPILEIVRLLGSQQARVRQSAMDELRSRGWSEDQLKYALELASGSPTRQMDVLLTLQQEAQLNLAPWLEWMACDGAPAVSEWAQTQLAEPFPNPHNSLLSQPQVVTAAFAASEPNSRAAPPADAIQDAAE